MTPALSFTLMRVVPIVALVAVAILSQRYLGLGRLPAAGLGLVVALVLRLLLPRIWPQP